ncbi:MAG: hypothetical protein WD740_04610 [Anaerolineales bacterium]
MSTGKPEEKKSEEEVKEDLKADRDDSLGYSREQFTFEEEPDKPPEKEVGRPKK